MTRLTPQALDFLKNNPVVAAQCAQAIGLNSNSVATTINRNAGSLTRLPALRILSNAMGQDMDKLIMERDAVTAQ